jgi:hypothetical protein
MTFRRPTRVLAAVLTLAAAEVRGQGHMPTHNNPLAQGNMYNLNSGPLRFNNPTNQVGMYASDPVLRFNDPLYQGNAVPGGFNNPLNQGNAVPGGFNNPLNQGNAVPGGFNNPLNQGNGAFNGFNTQAAQTGVVNNRAVNQGGLGNALNSYTNAAGANYAVGGGFSNFGLMGNGFYPGYAAPLYQGPVFGWGSPYNTGGGNGSNFNNANMPNNLNRPGSAASRAQNKGLNAAATLNGLGGTGNKSARGKSPSRKSPSRKKR